MARDNSDSTILFEHRKIVTARHILALINFIAILVGTVVTRHFVLVRGSSDGVLMHINIMLAINIVQIGLCLADYITKNFFGLYLKPIVIGSYSAGAIWFLLVLGELVAGTMELGNLRLDLAIIAVLQFITAIIAYFVWPSLDYSAIQKLTSKSIREDSEKRSKKASGFVVRYVIICVVMVVVQAAMFVAYKVPPTVYDIFSDTRALRYTPSEDGEGYVVSGVYLGTSQHVNVPATYNNKPVVGISAGALSDVTFIEKYKISDITIGTPTVDENGNEVIVSNVKFIDAGAIVNDKIESLSLPSSVLNIGVGAIKSTSLKNVLYEAQADFSIAYLDCTSLASISMDGENVGNIVSLDGMSQDVTIKVAKDIYNEYRQKNPEYVHSFRPIISETEFCVDFYTDCTYYINSIFATIGEKISVSYKDLINKEETGTSLIVDTESYIKNNHELGTNGAKADSAFRGWYSDRAMTQEHKFSLDGALEFTTDTALYAKWIDEYTGTLDWGTYQPGDVYTTMYWTNEDVISLPTYTTREGYKNGVQWFTQGVNDQIINTASLSENKTFKATWVLDKPTNVDIEPSQIGTWPIQISQDKNDVQFTYDELNILALSAKYNHVLDGNGNEYSIKWTKVGNDAFTNAQSSINVQNVLDSGEYVMTVTVKSKWGETSSESTNIRINVAKKALNIGTAKLDQLANGDATYKDIYNGKNHTLEVDESRIVDNNVEVIYTYFDKDGKEVSKDTGVKHAGIYKVKALFQKNNATEQSNYETKELQASFEIKPKPLTFVSWSATSLVYNASTQKVFMNVSGIVAGDTCAIVYKDGSNAQKDHGEYKAEAIGVGNSDYTLSGIDDNCTHEWEIKQKTVTILDWKIDGTNSYTTPMVYNGKTHTVYATMDGILGSDKVSFVYDQTLGGLSGKTAGDYTAKIIGIDNSNYTFDETDSKATLSWKITKAPVTVTFIADSALEYNGEKQGIIAVIDGIASEDFELMNAENFLYTGKSSVVEVSQVANTNKLSFVAKNADTYTASVSGLKTGTYLYDNYTLTSKNQTFTIAKKAISFTPKTYTYNGAAQDLEIVINGIAASDVDTTNLSQFTVEGITAITASNGSVKLVIENKKNAGSYDYKISAFSNSNYSMTPVTAGSHSIAKKNLSITGWEIVDEATNDKSTFNSSTSVTYNYDGYTIKPVVTGKFDTFELSLTNSFVKNADTYTVTATLPSAQTTNYNLPTASATVKVNPYEVNFDWSFSKTGTGSFVYDGSTVTVSPVYETLGNDSLTLSYSSSQKSAKDVGDYTVTVSSVGNTNYSVGTGYSKTWRITPKTVTVSWNAASSYTYNGQYQAPTFSVEGLVDSGAYVGLNIDGDMYYFSKASTYAIADKNATKDAGTYNLSVPAIYKYGSSSYSVDNNYTVSSTTAERSFTIGKKAITISNDWTYKKGSDLSTGAYTGAVPYNSYSYTLGTTIASGVISGDSVSLVYGGTYSASDVSLESYVAKVTGVSNSNYTLSGTNLSKTWSIAPKKLNFTWTANSFTYSGSTLTQSASVISGNATGETDGKLYSGDSTSIIYSGNTAINAGTYTATITGVSNSNYTLGTGTSYTWTIAKKAITPSWSYATTVYNGSAQYPKATYSGATFTYSGDTSKSDAGSYKVTAALSTESAKNYTIASGSSCDFEITRKPITVTWSGTSYTYDGTDHILSASPSGTVSGDSISLTLSSTSKYKNAGSYEYSIKAISGTDAANYMLSTSAVTTKSMVINPKTLSITWPNTTYTYTGSPQSFAATLTGFISGDSSSSVSVVYGLNGNQFTDAGTYTVSIQGITGTNASNYTVSTTSKSFTIQKKAVTVTWSGSASVIYDANAHSLTPSVYSGVITADKSYVSASTTGSGTNAGTYTLSATLSGTKAGNYEITTGAKASLVISQATVSVSWPSTKTYTYDGTSHSLVPTVTGIGGESVSFSYGSSGNSRKAAGSTTVTIASLSNANYKLPTSGTSATLTINKKALSTSWSFDGYAFSGTTATTTYDGSKHTLAVSLSGIVSGDSVSVVYEGGVNSYTNAGTYTIKASSITGSSADNYSFSSSSRTLIIEKAVATVTWTVPSNLKADDTAKTVSVTVTGVNGEQLDNTFTIKRGTVSVTEIKSAGSYTLTLTNTSYSNYTLSSTTKTLTVTQ